MDTTEYSAADSVTIAEAEVYCVPYLGPIRETMRYRNISRRRTIAMVSTMFSPSDMATEGSVKLMPVVVYGFVVKYIIPMVWIELNVLTYRGRE